jgi:hypothetical protein
MATVRHLRARSSQPPSGSPMRRLAVAAGFTALLLIQAGQAFAAGGRGSSYCSIATKPDGVVVIGDLSTYDNPGEFVTALAPLPGDPGSGWGVQHVCNPNRFAP